jgi:NADH dehydrogenase/NADH:ubiquinone oxidoreductase subunit G
MCDYGRTTFLDNRAGDRAPSSLTREDGRFVDASAEHVAVRAAASLRQAGRVGIVASASLTMEEGFLLSEIAELLGGAKRIVISPSKSDVPDDGRLISTDRFPNRRGLLALGFAEASSFGETCDGIVVVRCDPATDGGEWKTSLENALSVVVVGDRVVESASYADHLLAIASHFEAEGALVNRQGHLQSYAPAVPPPGSAVPGWQALAAVVAALGGRAYSSRRDVLEGMLNQLKAGKDPIIAASPS